MSRKAAAVLVGVAAAAVYLTIISLEFFAFWPRSIQFVDCRRHPAICFAIPMATLAGAWLWTRRNRTLATDSDDKK